MCVEQVLNLCIRTSILVLESWHSSQECIRAQILNELKRKMWSTTSPEIGHFIGNFKTRCSDFPQHCWPFCRFAEFGNITSLEISSVSYQNVHWENLMSFSAVMLPHTLKTSSSFSQSRSCSSPPLGVSDYMTTSWSAVVSCFKWTAHCHAFSVTVELCICAANK